LSEKFKVEASIEHNGKINIARYMPQITNIVATQSSTGSIYIFDSLRQSTNNEQFNPELTLAGQKKEGDGLSWNGKDKGKLLGSSRDGLICMWDVEGASKLYSSVDPVVKYEAHKASVRSIEWSMHFAEIFASAGSDKQLLIWDTRRAPSVPVYQINAHTEEVLSVSFNPFKEHILATSSADKTITIWDTRNLKTKQHSFKEHQSEVLSISWAPFNEALLASASRDRRVFIWDLTLAGKPQTKEEVSEGPPELLFIHGGHRGPVNDVAWNPSQDLMIASVAEDGILQIWQMVIRNSK
jgi:WD40 repeat protein